MEHVVRKDNRSGLVVERDCGGCIGVLRGGGGVGLDGLSFRRAGVLGGFGGLEGVAETAEEGASRALYFGGF